MADATDAARSAQSNGDMRCRPGTSQLRAGIAPVTITPDRPLLLEGYGSRQGTGHGHAR